MGDTPETYDPFPRPGDANFTGFPKELPDDTVKYSLCLISAKAATPTQRRSRLSEVLAASKRIVRDQLRDFIWQRDAFVLDFDESGHSRLEGSVEFGDSIADEWVVVYILCELSRQFEDAWIRATDADGQFLLVEAANALPSWLNPDVADYRVWINNGHLKIIPKSLHSVTTATRHVDPLNYDQAVKFIQTSSKDLIHDLAIETEAFSRIRQYPASIHSLMHTARIMIPRKLAYVLQKLPSSTSQATEALYLRDSISCRPLSDESGKSLAFPPIDLVSMCVRFNRTSYAQSKSQNIAAPGPWASVIAESKTKDSEALKTGMKLACGYDMLLADKQNQDKRVVREIQLLHTDLEEGEDVLPSDEDMKNLPDVGENEDWLDVNFEDFEAELSGKRAATGGTRGAFKDKIAQENLQRIVNQFQNFLDDEHAGIEGAEVKADSDDDFSDEDEEGASNDTGHNGVEALPSASNDEDSQYANMMGMLRLNGTRRTNEPSSESVESLDSADEDISYEDLQALSQLMEAELEGAGALNLNDPMSATSNSAESDSVYTNLAKNILEALKQQPGQAGPANNILASMGLNLPPDADE